MIVQNSFKLCCVSLKNLNSNVSIQLMVSWVVFMVICNGWVLIIHLPNLRESSYDHGLEV